MDWWGDMSLGEFKHYQLRENSHLYQTMQDIIERIEKLETTADSNKPTEGLAHGHQFPSQNLHRLEEIKSHFEETMENISYNVTKATELSKAFRNEMIYLQVSNQIVENTHRDTIVFLKSVTKKLKTRFTELENVIENYGSILVDARPCLDNVEEGLGLRLDQDQNTLTFYNIPERDDRECAEIILDFCEEILRLSDAKKTIFLSHAYRDGILREGSTSNRPIVTRFTNAADCHKVRKRAMFMLPVTPYSVSYEFSGEVQRRRCKLLRVLKHELDKGNRGVLVRDKLYINDVIYSGPQVDRRPDAGNIRFMVWNTNGLKTKLAENRGAFVQMISDFDVVFICESNVGKMSSEGLAIPEGFTMVHSPGWKKASTKAKRYRGGVSLIYRKAICRNAATPENTKTQDGISRIWLTFPKENFKIDQTVSICCLYLPPETSTFYESHASAKKHLTTTLLQDVGTYTKKGKVFVCGDFNARVRNEPDYTDDDAENEYGFETIVDDYGNESRERKAAFTRATEDDTKNGFGNELLTLCIKTGLRIVNGRLHGDKDIGKATCHQGGGRSVVDYLLARKEDFKDVTDFRVGAVGAVKTDHNPIIFELNIPKDV